MGQSGPELWKAEYVTRSKQLARLYPPAGKDERVCHFPEQKTQKKCWDRHARPAPQSAAECLCKLGIAHWIGADRVDRSTEAIIHQHVLNDRRQLVSPDPAGPLATAADPSDIPSKTCTSDYSRDA
jgi:hypothetical protein